MTEADLVARSTLRKNYPHGFKSRARRIADQVRMDTGHGVRDPLDTAKMLKHLGLDRWKLSAFADIAADRWVPVAQLYVVDPSAFSGALIGAGHRRVVLVNDAHTSVRQRATEAHEAGHALLGHVNTPFLSGSMVRSRDAQVEAEADFLGMCLLVPEPYTLAVARQHRHVSDHDRREVIRVAAEAMDVSTDMMQWAFNATAAWRRVTSRQRV